MASIKAITPFVLTADMDRALAFYEGRLGFECSFRADNYAYVRREGAAIRLVETGPDESLPRTPATSMSKMSIRSTRNWSPACQAWPRTGCARLSIRITASANSMLPTRMRRF